ncbi:hypothetical protein ACVWWO_002256 [Bradyrhizobium sp. F1.13.1]
MRGAGQVHDPMCRDMAASCHYADGALLSSGGRLVNAVSAVSGKLPSLDVGIGDEVRRDQVIARIVQTEQRLQQARDVLREREHVELTGAISREIDAMLLVFGAPGQLIAGGAGARPTIPF